MDLNILIFNPINLNYIATWTELNMITIFYFLIMIIHEIYTCSLETLRELDVEGMKYFWASVFILNILNYRMIESVQVCGQCRRSDCTLYL